MSVTVTAADPWPASPNSSFRIDIQALRGLAVLLVLLYHARLGPFRAGYLGVDVFFVISGYLVTTMVTGRIDSGRFRFSEFYLRRARRLLPATYVTLVLVLIAAFHLLDIREWRDFAYQVLGALTFSGNIVLWKQSGYFSGEAELKPLLHVWSLSLEEQYYLLLPAAMVLMPRRLWLPAGLVLTTVSLALHWTWARTAPDAAFYLLPSRAWELGLGSLAALVAGHRSTVSAPGLLQWLFWPALVALLAVPTLAENQPAPVGNLMVCLATLVVIMRRHRALGSGRLLRILAKLGDVSFSLYLVHWPILVFIHSHYAADPVLRAPPVSIRLLAVLASILLAFLMYHWIERPFRSHRVRGGRLKVALTAAVSVVIAATPLALLQRVAHSSAYGPGGQTADRDDNVGFGERCDQYQRIQSLAECSNSENPKIVVWGDSFAMHLVPAIAASIDAGVLQVTKSSCGPFLDLSQITPEYPRSYAENCLMFNRSVYEFLALDRSIEVVVLASAVYPYFDRGHRQLLLHGEQGLEVVTPSMPLALHSLSETIRQLRELGLRVVVVAPPPSNGFDYTLCLERKASARTLSAFSLNCNIPRAEYQASKADVLEFLDRLGSQADVAVIGFDEILCGPDECVTALDGVFLYRDEGHLSTVGSQLLGRRMQLGERLFSAAR